MREEEAQQNRLGISVIIPTFNEEKYIEDTLRALAMQQYSEKCFEVILVDNESTDSTIAIAKNFCSTLQVRILTFSGRSISQVRNYGAEVAKGSILAFLDADCLPGPVWLSDGFAAGQRNQVWGAHYAIPPDATWVGEVWTRYQAKEQEGAVSFLPAGDLFIFRDDFLKLGGFNPNLETSEDVELCQRAENSGMQIVAHRQLAVSHRGTPSTLRQFYKQNRWHGKHVFRKFLAEFPSTRNLPVVGLTVYTFAMLWTCIVSIVIGIMKHQWELPIGFLILLVGPFIAISLSKTVRKGKLTDAPELTVLYATYFIARAAALTHGFKRNHR
jgi:glycosyltransferase involved in cell wall biosynthesis